MSIGSLTVVQAKARLAQLNDEAIQINSRTDLARRRVHEFAPATRDHDFALQSLTLDDIDNAFYKVCRETTDRSSLAARQGVPVEAIDQWAGVAAANTEQFLRMVMKRENVTQGYSMKCPPAKKKEAEGLMGRFRETLEKYDWVQESLGPALGPTDGDTILAEP